MKSREKNSKLHRYVIKKKHIKISSKNSDQLTLFISTMFEVAKDQGIQVDIINE